MESRTLTVGRSPRLRRALLRWYDDNRRDLPWRRTRDPFRIWVSEIMLQQTQVAAVISYYQRFMASFPDITTLANASEDDVLRHWSGLGYYSRARNLHQAAQIISQQHQGRFPQAHLEINALPGIGPSTAQKIVDFRQAHGAFHSVDELDAVPGIGAGRIAQLKGLVVP